MSSMERIGHLMLMRSKEERHENILLWLSIPRISRNPEFWKLLQYPITLVCGVQKQQQQQQQQQTEAQSVQVMRREVNTSLSPTWTHNHVSALRSAIVSAVLYTLAQHASIQQQQQQYMNPEQQNENENGDKKQDQIVTSSQLSQHETLIINQSQNHNSAQQDGLISCSQMSLGDAEQEQRRKHEKEQRELELKEREAKKAKDAVAAATAPEKSKHEYAEPAKNDGEAKPLTEGDQPNAVPNNNNKDQRQKSEPVYNPDGSPRSDAVARRLQRDLSRLDQTQALSRLFTRLDLFALLQPLAEHYDTAQVLEIQKKLEQQNQQKDAPSAANNTKKKQIESGKSNNDSVPINLNCECKRRICLLILSKIIEAKPELLDLLQLAEQLRFNDDFKSFNFDHQNKAANDDQNKQKQSGKRRGRNDESDEESETELDDDFLAANNIDAAAATVSGTAENKALQQALLFAHGGWKPDQQMTAESASPSQKKRVNVENNDEKNHDDTAEQHDQHEENQISAKDKILKAANKEIRHMMKENRQQQNQQQQPKPPNSANTVNTTSSITGTFDDFDAFEAALDREFKQQGPVVAITSRPVPQNNNITTNNKKPTDPKPQQRPVTTDTGGNQMMMMMPNNNNNNQIQQQQRKQNYDEDEDDDEGGYINDDEIQIRQNNNNNNQQNNKKRRQAWSQEEDDAILQGIQRFTTNTRFTDMFKYYQGVWKPGRTATQVSEHYRCVLSKKAFR